jgi:adenosine kinase
MRVVITGSVAFDYLMTFPGKFKDALLADQLDSLSLSFLVDSLVKRRGGTAPNIAYSLALLGEHPTIMATVGEDFADYRAALEAAGVDTSAIKVITGESTASFFVTTDQSLAQIASFYPGAMAHATELSLADLNPRPDLVVISPNDPAAMRKYVQECKALGIPYWYDPSQQIARVGGEELREGVDGAAALLLNEYEFALLQEKTGYTAAQLLAKIPLVVVTRGAKGATIYAEGKEITIPVAPPRHVEDPTGAGDAFRGGLLKGYMHGLPWEIAGRIGALTATYCLEVSGTQGQHYTPAEFQKRFCEIFGKEVPCERVKTAFV